MLHFSILNDEINLVTSIFCCGSTGQVPVNDVLLLYNTKHVTSAVGVEVGFLKKGGGEGDEGKRREG